jgi:hypothetical protein
VYEWVSSSLRKCIISRDIVVKTGAYRNDFEANLIGYLAVVVDDRYGGS